MQNIKQDLAARYETVLIVATDKKAYAIIERVLAKEQLLIPKRVLLLLAGKDELRVYNF